MSKDGSPDIVPKLPHHVYRGTGYRPEITSSRVLANIHLNDSLPPWAAYKIKLLTCHLTFMVKFKFKGRGAGYRPKISSARVSKWSQTIVASLSNACNHKL